MDVERREKILGWVTRGGESESDYGVGVPMEVRLHRFKKFKIEVQRWGKIVVSVRRGEESESDVGVRVTLEVRLHSFKRCKNGGRESEKIVE